MSEQPAVPAQAPAPASTKKVGDNTRTSGVVIASIAAVGLLLGLIGVFNGSMQAALVAISSVLVMIVGLLMLCAGYLAQIAAQGEARK